MVWGSAAESARAEFTTLPNDVSAKKRFETKENLDHRWIQFQESTNQMTNVPPDCACST